MLLYWPALKLAEDKEGDRDHQAASQQDKLLFVDALLAGEIGACRKLLDPCGGRIFRQLRGGCCLWRCRRRLDYDFRLFIQVDWGCVIGTFDAHASQPSFST